MHYCLLTGQFVKNSTISVQFIYVALYAPYAELLTFICSRL